jgi:hypothetical protein
MRPSPSTFRAGRRRLAWIAALCAPPLAAAAAPIGGAGYRLDGQALYGGGGHSSGAHAQLAGSVGQPAAGRAAGAHYTLDGGFWTPQRANDRIFANGFERTQP